MADIKNSGRHYQFSDCEWNKVDPTGTFVEVKSIIAKRANQINGDIKKNLETWRVRNV
jgi:hypothetical protein